MTFKNIQGLRAVAVLLVLASHFHDFSDRFGANAVTEFMSVVGSWGVDLFFVISGFIMISVHWQDFAKPGITKIFLTRRIIRIIPPYWLLTLLLAAAFAAKPALVHGWPGAKTSLFLSLLLLPTSTLPVLFVGWTLVYEMFFYYIFGLALAFPQRVAFTVLGIWALAIVAAQFFPSIIDNTYGRVYLGNLCLEFLFGVVLGSLAMRKILRFGTLSIVVGCVLVAAIAAYVTASHFKPPAEWPPRAAFVGIPLGLILYGAVVLERVRSMIMPRALQAIGDASYSIYLWHMIVYIGAGRLLTVLIRHGVPTLAFLVVTPIAVVVIGLLVYRYVEVPLLRIARRVATRILPNALVAKPQFAAQPN